MQYDDFKGLFMELFHSNLCIKGKKLIRSNNASFTNKSIYKAELENKYNQFPAAESNLNKKKEKNDFVNLVKKMKEDYYRNLISTYLMKT